MGTRIMLNLRENYHNPQGRLPGKDTTITALSEMHFGNDDSRKGKGGLMQEFASRGSEDRSIAPGTASSNRGTTIGSGAEIQMHDPGAQRQEAQSYGENTLPMEEEDPKV